MPYQLPSLDGLHAILIALFKSMLPDRAIGSRFDLYWKITRVIAGGGTDVHAHVLAAVRDVFPTTARGGALDRMLSIWKPGGLAGRKGATGAHRTSAGRVRGTAGVTITAGTTAANLRHRPTGLLFTVSRTATIPSGGFVDVDIAATSLGAATRLAKGEVLEFLAPAAGVQTKVELQHALDQDGADQELDGSGLARLLDRLGAPSSGGNVSDIVALALAQPGIAQAFAYPNRDGLGTLDVVGLHTGTGADRALLAGEMSTLLAALAAAAPAQLAANGAGLRVLTVVTGATDAANLANVEITYSPDGLPGHDSDWDDRTPPVVASWNATTLTLQFTAARPSTMQAGDRIVLRGVASSQDGAPVVIAALTGTDSVILQSAPAAVGGAVGVPAATDVVYSGGPVADVIRAAVIAYLTGVDVLAGPAGPLPTTVADAAGLSTADLQVLVPALGPANPGGIYGAWSGTLTPGALSAIAVYTRGVRAHTVITPAAPQDAVDYPFPSTGSIGLLTPGSVIVRRA